MSFKLYLKSALVLFLAIGISSCVKDIDLNQAGDIGLSPQIQIDLLVFSIDETDFLDKAGGNQYKEVIRDTVRLEFLDDSYIQKDLEQVAFSFRYINSFSHPFYSKISFLSENNEIQHMVEFFVESGSKNNPEVTENIELIAQDQIQLIKQSIKMVVEIEVLPNEAPFAGNLDFASKGHFFFEF